MKASPGDSDTAGIGGTKFSTGVCAYGDIAPKSGIGWPAR